MNHFRQEPFLALAPAACGWRAAAVTQRGECSMQESATFSEAAAAAFALASELRLNKAGGRGVAVHVALPLRCAVCERLTLPAVENGEQAGMVRLQFEKSLPYPAEETALGFQIVAQNGSQTTLLACAAHQCALESVFAPLLERQFPGSVTLWAMHLAAQSHGEAAVCALWREEEEIVFGVFENGRLGFAEILPGGSGAVCSALPCALMRAELAGAVGNFEAVLLDPALDALRESLAGFFGVPVRALLLQCMERGDAPDLTPATWRAEAARRERSRRRWKQAVIAGAVYCAIGFAALLSLAIQGRRLEALRKEAAALRPQMETILSRQNRWRALAPAIDPRRFAAELLFQAWQCLPTPETRITRFELGGSQWLIEGEAPSAQQAIAFSEALKHRPGLEDCRFESAPPVILPNEHAQFRIFGKL